MKAQILMLLIVLAVLAVLAYCITGCTPKNSYLIQAMKLAPEGLGHITCIDIEAMAEDPELEDWCNEIIIGMSYEWSYEVVGIGTSDISASSSILHEGDTIVVWMGDFSFENIRATLEEGYYVEGEYKGVEIWTDVFEDAVAFIDNMIVAGYKEAVEACIRTHKNEESSMYDNEDMREVADKMPNSIIQTVFGLDYIYI